MSTLAGKLTPVNEIKRVAPMMRRSITITPIGTRIHDLMSADLFAFHV
jgi:hypothetical protein